MRNRPLDTLKHAKTYLKGQRGIGNLQDAIARNRALETLDEAIRQVILNTYQQEELVARGQAVPLAEEI